jgi:circadian clock protein KaiC
MSHIADNVVLLQHVPDGSQMRRALTVLKARASMSSAVVREFTISTDGITLGQPLGLHRLLD